MFFSSLIDAGSSAVGASIAVKARIWNRWVTTMSRIGAGLLVERRPPAESERLGHVDLHVGDEVAVPDRLEQSVGEPEREDVLRRLLAEEVVDPEDPLLGEDLVQVAFSATALARSVPNGFSMMIRARSTRLASPSIRTTDSAALRRHAQVVQPPGLARRTCLRLLDRLAQRAGPGVHRHVVEAVGEGIPLLLGELVVRELVERLLAPSSGTRRRRGRPATCRRSGSRG